MTCDLITNTHTHLLTLVGSFIFHRVAGAAVTIEIATGIVVVGTEAGVVAHLTAAAIPKTIGKETMDTAEEVRSWIMVESSLLYVSCCAFLLLLL
jgi:hypothetical protein